MTPDVAALIEEAKALIVHVDNQPSSAVWSGRALVSRDFLDRLVAALQDSGAGKTATTEDELRAKLEALRTVSDKATGGPWYREYARIVVCPPDCHEGEAEPERYIAGTVPDWAKTNMRDPQRIADAEFIVAAVNLVRQLLSAPPVVAEVPALQDTKDSANQNDLRAKLEAVRALHLLPHYCPDPRGNANTQSYYHEKLCPTILALDGEREPLP